MYAESVGEGNAKDKHELGERGHCSPQVWLRNFYSIYGSHQAERSSRKALLIEKGGKHSDHFCLRDVFV